jgi:hypothetical protein
MIICLLLFVASSPVAPWQEHQRAVEMGDTIMLESPNPDHPPFRDLAAVMADVMFIKVRVPPCLSSSLLSSAAVDARLLYATPGRPVCIMSGCRQYVVPCTAG